MSDLKINKSGSHCHDGTEWNTCDFWYYIENNPEESYCKLFGEVKGVKKYGSRCLKICDKIYEKFYKGDV